MGRERSDSDAEEGTIEDERDNTDV